MRDASRHGTPAEETACMRTAPSDSPTVVRPSWLHAVVTALQIAVGQIVVSELADLGARMAALPDAIPSPASPAETRLLASSLLEFVVRCSASAHRHAHEAGRALACPFDPIRFVDAFGRDAHADPLGAFRRWAADFFAALWDTHAEPLAERMARTVREDYASPWTIATLKQRVKASTARMRSAFKGEYGLSPHEYQRVRRVIAALENIRSEKADTAASAAGYRSTSTMYRAVEEVTGLSLTALRSLPAEELAGVVDRLHVRLLPHGATGQSRVTG